MEFLAVIGAVTIVVLLVMAAVDIRKTKKREKRVPILLDEWVLAWVNEGSSYSSDKLNECHAGIVRFPSEPKEENYAVQFPFGTRWVKRGQLDPVTREQAAHAVPSDVGLLEQAGEFRRKFAAIRAHEAKS